MAPVLDLEVYYFTCTDLPRGLTSVLIVINIKYTKFVSFDDLKQQKTNMNE